MEEKTPILILQMGTDFNGPPKKIQIEIIMEFNVPKAVCFRLQSIESETPIEIVSRNQTTPSNPPTSGKPDDQYLICQVLIVAPLKCNLNDTSGPSQQASTSPLSRVLLLLPTA